MNKRLLICAVIISFMTLCLNVDTYAQQNDEPDYILGRPMTEEEIEEQRSFIPKNMPILPEYTPPVLEEQSTYLAPNGASYASRYNAAEHGLVTPVKNQNTSNWCWVYSTVSSMETSLIKKKIVTNGAVSTASNLDLSEASLAYYMYNRTVVSDPLGLTRYDKNIYHPNAGETSYVYYSGNNILLAEFLSTSMGIKNESYFTLQNAYDGYTPDISSAYKNNVALLKSTVFIPDDTNSLKSAILTYGSATVGIYYDDYYYNFNTGAYSYPYTTSVTNHAVTVVGWDDSYSYTNFESTSNVTRNGAWIVKNSWGPYFGDNGYIYVSYYDKAFLPYCAIEMQSANAYDNNYMYDGSSCNTWTRFASGTKIANSYVAVGGRQQLKQVSIEMMDNNQSYSLQIYKNVSSTSNPSKGTAVLSTPIKGTIKNTGIYTINLPSGIYLEKGERYSVVFTITSSSGNVFIGSEYDNNYGWFSNDAYLSAKQSYYLWAGDKTWSDGYIITGYCARIKAYTDNSTAKKVTFKDSAGAFKTVYVANGGSIKISSIAKKGYSVASASGRYTNVTADSVVTVTWKPNKYRIIYNANGGSVKTSTKTVTYGSRCGTLAAPKRKGYDFKGWYTSKKYTSKIASTTYYKTAGNLTLYAKWSKVKVAKSTVRKLTSTSRRTLKVSIKKISNASGYVIQYSTKRNMKGAKTLSTTSRNKTLSGLSSGKTYYVRVRAYHKDSAGKKVYGSYSSVKKITVK